MEPSEIELGDWQRILFGNISPLFLIEVFFRTLVVYLALLLVVKLLGKRMSGQLTLIEMAVMLTLGAIVSVPMQMPNMGVLQGLLILTVALFIHQGINYMAFLSPRADNLVHGSPTVLVKNGVMQLKEMEEVHISRQQLFSELRSRNIYQLGKVGRVYLETAGSITVIPAKEDRPGLSLYPPSDEGMLIAQKDPSPWVCTNCGTICRDVNPEECPGCNYQEFIKATN